MKKILCLLLASLMLLSLCSCFGGKDEDEVRGEIVSGDKQNTDDEKAPEFSLGSVASNTYNNDFLGLSCTLPSEWTFYSEAEILEINNIAGEFYDEDVKKQLENATVIYDMYAVVAEKGNNINVNLEKLNVLQAAAVNIKTTLESQIDIIKSSYENMGYTDVEIAYQKITVDGKELDGLKFSAKIQGIGFYGLCFTFLKENYLANVTLSTLQTDNTSEILGYFKLK